MCCQNSLQIKKLSKNGGAFLEALKQGHVEFDPTGELFIELADIRAQLHEHYEEIFCEHYRDLVAFKNEFGHCKVPSNYENNPSLGSWCRTMRSYYNNIRLSPDRIERLEKIGFVWNVTNEKFEERYRELLAFKKEFGHDKVPTGRLYANNPSLGRWCQRMRYLYSSTHPGINRLSPDRIARLEEIGFKWKINETLFEHAVMIFKHSKRSLDIAKFLVNMQSINYWQLFVQIRDTHTIPPVQERIVFHQTRSSNWKKPDSNGMLMMRNLRRDVKN